MVMHARQGPRCVRRQLRVREQGTLVAPPMLQEVVVSRERLPAVGFVTDEGSFVGMDRLYVSLHMLLASEYFPAVWIVAWVRPTARTRPEESILRGGNLPPPRPLSPSSCPPHIRRLRWRHWRKRACRERRRDRRQRALRRVRMVDGKFSGRDRQRLEGWVGWLGCWVSWLTFILRSHELLFVIPSHGVGKDLKLRCWWRRSRLHSQGRVVWRIHVVGREVRKYRDHKSYFKVFMNAYAMKNCKVS